MKALVIGRGSMGRRRIRDLTALGHEVTSWDINDQELVPQSSQFDVSVVCTPPDRHRAYGRGPNFIEAGVEPVTGTWVYPSCTSRFTAFYALFQRLLDGEIDHPSAYTLHVGQHLADWHPGADLGTYYAAQRATGACREMVPFELCWLTGLFGAVDRAMALRANTADIADIDDVYQVLVRHQGGTLGHILIDALSRPARRSFTLVSEGYTRTFDLEYREQDYLEEIRAFVEAAEGRQAWPYTAAQDSANLEVLRAIERTS